MYKINIAGDFKMDNIPSSFIGYNKQAVDEIIKQKDNKLNTQQKDIDYLRNEILRLEKDALAKSKNNHKK